MSNYEKQANDFLTKTNTTIKARFIKYDKYFMDDKEERDIFNITIQRESKKYNFTFGQSIAKSTGQENFNNKPSAYDVLAGLTKYDVGDFDNFCSDFGYNDLQLSKYQEVLKIYNAVIEEYKMVCNLWNEEERKELEEIWKRFGRD